MLQLREAHGNIAAASAYTLLPSRQSRKWAVITNTGAAPLTLYPTLDGKIYGDIYLAVGSTLVFSETGDMPFNGQVDAQAVGVDSYVYCTECFDAP